MPSNCSPLLWEKDTELSLTSSMPLMILDTSMRFRLNYCRQRKWVYNQLIVVVVERERIGISRKKLNGELNSGGRIFYFGAWQWLTFLVNVAAACHIKALISRVLLHFQCCIMYGDNFCVVYAKEYCCCRLEEFSISATRLNTRFNEIFIGRKCIRKCSLRSANHKLAELTILPLPSQAQQVLPVHGVPHLTVSLMTKFQFSLKSTWRWIYQVCFQDIRIYLLSS